MSEVNSAMRDMMMDIGAAATWVNSKLRIISSQKNKNGDPTPDAKTAQNVGNINPTSITAAANPNKSYTYVLGDGTSRTSYMNESTADEFRKKYASGHQVHGQTMLSFGLTKMAKGGIIGEKIFGIGESGRQYMFGEAGPETVTPGVGTTNNNGGATTFNITINAQGIGDIERQLKPAILKMLKESTSRAGIV